MQITGVDHTSFTVSNLERSLEFYIGILGFEVIWRREITNTYFRDIVGMPDAVVDAVHLSIPNSTHKLELFEYKVPRGILADVRNNNFGSSHLSLRVVDLQEIYTDLKSRGVTFRSEPVAIDFGANAGAVSVYMFDPDGITVELIQPAAG